jgi:hypothetical protein
MHLIPTPHPTLTGERQRVRLNTTQASPRQTAMRSSPKRLRRKSAIADFGSTFDNKLWSGVTSLGNMAATEGAQYLTHMAYSASRGNTGAAMFSDAWAYNDITFNVANIGTIMGAVGFIAGVNGDGYDAGNRSAFNKIAGALGAVGLDLTLSNQGISGSLGSSGYNLMDIGMRIGKGLVLSKKLEDYAATHGTTS